MIPVGSNHWFEALEKLPTFEDIRPRDAEAFKLVFEKTYFNETALLPLATLEDGLDWSMVMCTEMPLYDSDEAPTYGPHGRTMRVKLVDDPDNNRYHVSFRLQVSTKEIVKELMKSRWDRHKLIADLENRLQTRKEKSKELTNRMDKRIADPENNSYHVFPLGRGLPQTMRNIAITHLNHYVWCTPIEWRVLFDFMLGIDKQETILRLEDELDWSMVMCTEMPLYDSDEAPTYGPHGRTMRVKLVGDPDNKSYHVSFGLQVSTKEIVKELMKSRWDRHKLIADLENRLQTRKEKSKELTNRMDKRIADPENNMCTPIEWRVLFDFMLGIDKQETILRKKGIDMDILCSIVDALAEECNCDGNPVLTTCQLLNSAPACFGRKAVGDLSKTAMKKERHRLRRIRRMDRRVVPRRRCLAQNRKTKGLASLSDPIAADNSSLTPEQTWRVASAAPQHMTGYLNHLVNYTPASGDQVIDTPNMGPMAVHGHGSVNTASMTLGDVLYVPGLDASLVSTGQLAELGHTIAIGPYGCRIYKNNGGMNLVGKAHYVDGYLLELDFLRVASTN